MINPQLLMFCISVGTMAFFFCETDWLYHYLKSFLWIVGQKLPYHDQYNDARRHGEVHYLKYLAYRTDSFWLNLLSCPLCLIFWVTLIFCTGLTAVSVKLAFMSLFVCWGPVAFVATATYLILAFLKRKLTF